MIERMIKLVVVALALVSGPSWADITVTDDQGSQVTLKQPARRIISMAPHVTELLFAAGGGDRIVGAVSYSDYPEAALKIPRIGDNSNVDLERIVALKPDLFVIWRHGSSERQLDYLRHLGIPMFFSEPHKLEDIPSSVARLSRLLATEHDTEEKVRQMSERVASLRKRYAGRPSVSVFYQVWDKPLYTLNGRHIVSDAIRLCGGRNVFDGLSTVAPSVTTEAVVQADPDAVIGTAEKTTAIGGVYMWKRFPAMRAVASDNLLTLDGSLINRPGPRMLDGTEQLCGLLETARTHLAAHPVSRP